jgi:hypothetical protein
MTAAGVPYPREGCCQHSANSHTRDHCLACECLRPPIQAQTAPAAPADPGLAELHECNLCHALTTTDREPHIKWHERQADTLETILSRLAMLILRGHRTDSQ